MKVLMVGGVAGGASCAARLRRLDEKAEIVMVERGPYVSYANCGLPYHVSGVIEEEAVFRVDARTSCEAVAIDPKKKTVDLRDVATGKVTTESYDKLVLSPGAAPIRPPLPGIDLPGIFSVRTVPDARTIRQWLHRGEETRTGMDSYTGHQVVTKPKRAVVVGGGFIGLEMVESFAHLGLEVTLVEKLNQVMPPLDPEMARLVERYLGKHGVKVELSDGVAGFRQTADGALEVLTEKGKAHPADVVMLAIGVRPEAGLARAAGLEIGQRGGIRVDEHLRTSDPDILAVGDAVEVKDWVTGQWTLIPLAGPANRQGRIAADVIAGRDSRYRGTQGTSICKIFEGTIAQTGVSEKTLRQLGDTDWEKAYLYPNSHAGYYPGANYAENKDSQLGTLDLAGSFDLTLKPILSPSLRGQNWQGRRYFWIRLGYDHVFKTEDRDSKETSEHRGIVAVHGRTWLPGRIFVEGRLRADLRWIGSEYSTRYRARLEVNRDFLVGGRTVTPYLQIEPFYDTRYDDWSRALYQLGAEIQVRKLLHLDKGRDFRVEWENRAHFRLEPYVALQVDWRPEHAVVTAFGIVARWYF